MQHKINVFFFPLGLNMGYGNRNRGPKETLHSVWRQKFSWPYYHMGHGSKNCGAYQVWATKISWPLYHMGHGNKNCGPYQVWATKYFVALSTPWATKTRNRGPKGGMGHENFRRPHADIERHFAFFDAQPLGFDSRTSKTFSPPCV